MAVVHAVVGAPTPDGATFVAKVDGGGPVRVAVADNAGMSSPTFTASQAVDAQGVAKVAITGLPASTQWWWQVEDNGAIDTGVTGRFRTAPTPGSLASYTFAAAGDAGAGSSGFVTNRVSNHPVFDTIRATDPEFFIHMGDMHYRDIGSGVHSPPPFDETDYRAAFDDMLTYNGAEGTGARQQHLFRECPLVPTWDNHDFGFTTGSSTDSDGTLPHKAAARTVFQERMPHYPLGAGSGNVPIYYSFGWGRVRYVMLDARSERSPNSDPDGPSKTMLGAAQKAWLDNLLATAQEPALCIISAVQWITADTETDTWNAYATERNELVEMFGDHGWLHRMWLLNASMHALGMDSGGGNQHGGFPVGAFAALDATPSNPNNLYNLGPTDPGVGRYGTVQITDLGSSILIRLAGWNPGGLWRTHQFGVPAADLRPATTGAVLRTLSGSHRATFEARVLTSYQAGEDPDGTEIPILSGDVQYDATAQVFATLDLVTLGVDEHSGKSQFPRRSGDLLAPYGNEVFVRRGVDLGDQILWSPLGYFRIEDAEQDDAPYGPIRLAGSDRMVGLIEARLIQPREYAPTVSVAALFADLIGDVYPDAVVVFDDDSALASIDRNLIADESRYEPLLEVASALGKIFYVDGTGLFQVRTAPDESTPLWEVRAGHNGVLVRAGRRVTRDGVFNGVVYRGEGGDTDNPVQGVAIDNGPNSPTRWGGRFGRVPRFHSSPFVTTRTQAEVAAREMLRRNIGAPYSVDFGTIVNPTLRPWDPIRVTQRDGNREIHVVERLTIPLTADATQRGSTKEKTFLVLGSVIQ